VEERERGAVEIKMETKEKDTNGGNRRRRQDKEEQRRRTDGISQGLMRNFRKLQGPFCKA
jgi:hypothetical protein